MGLLDIFRKKKEKTEAEPLRIEGIAPASLTPEPDDLEQAAEALLESLSPDPSLKRRGVKKQADSQPAEKGTAEYYHRLAERIRQAHDAATLRTMRFIAFCEQELRKPGLPKEGPGSLALLEAELYKRIDTIEREGGELKRRWQHCLAEVTVRLMAIDN